MNYFFCPFHRKKCNKIVVFVERAKTQFSLLIFSVKNLDEEMNQLIKSFKEQQLETIRVYVYPNGDRYEGEFNEKGQRHGKGIYTTPG